MRNVEYLESTIRREVAPRAPIMGCTPSAPGQEACGIATMNGLEMKCHKDVGLVGDVFSREILDELGGTMAVGHVRYSTTGGSRPGERPASDIKLRQGHLCGGPQRQSG